MAIQDDFIRTALRVPPDLHKKIHEAAQGDNRTFNAEIVDRLQRSFNQQESLLPELYLTVDMTDAPVCWDGIYEVVAALRKKMPLEIVNLSIKIVTPNLVSSSQYESETAKLAEKLKRSK